MSYNPIQTLTHLKPRGAGRPLRVTSMSAYEARQEALRLLHSGRVRTGTKARALIDLLGSAGILPGAYLQDLLTLHARSLRRYREKNLLVRLALPASLEALVPLRTRYLYALGVVGLELAALIHGMTPTGYVEAAQDKVSHDVLCNLVYYHLHRGVKALGYAAVLHNKYEATVHDFNGKPLLEPDAMVVMEHPARPRQVLLLEYHHEHFSVRAEEKVLKYERVLREQRDEWQAAWRTSDLPTVLVVWTHRAVGTGYARTFEQRRRQAVGTQARWLGKPLQAFLDQQTVLLWDNLATGQANERLLNPHE